MKIILAFTVFIILLSIIKVKEQAYDDLSADHDTCSRIKPPSHTGTIKIDTTDFVVPKWARLISFRSE